MLLITCTNCNLLSKDGLGMLICCYLDRIRHPEILKKRQYDTFDKKTSPKLTCQFFQTIIGSSSYRRTQLSSLRIG